MATIPRTESTDIDRGLALRLLVLLPSIALALRLFGFRRVYVWVLRHSTLAEAPAAELRHRAERITTTVIRVNRRVLPYESRCLLESLALLWLLRRAGVPAALAAALVSISAQAMTKTRARDPAAASR